MSSKRNRRWLALSAAFLVATALISDPTLSSPSPSVTANDGTQRVLVFPDQVLDLSVALSPDAMKGQNADWWLIASLPNGSFYYYDLLFGWQPGFIATYQGPLITLSERNVLSTKGLPPGTYNVAFGVDLNMNGDSDDGFYTGVKVKISGYDCPDTSNSLEALSDVQKDFVAARGNPDMFILGFASEVFGQENRAAYLPENSVRRIEHWVYNRDELTVATFDNGFFVKEDTVGEAILDLQDSSLSPSQLSPCTSTEDIVALMGEPSCTNVDTLSGRTYSYLRYNPTASNPATTIVLENGSLIAVLSGYSYDADSEPIDGNLCTDHSEEN